MAEEIQKDIADAEARLADLEAKQTETTAKWSEFEAAGTTGTEEGTACMTELCQLQQQIDECKTTIQFKKDQLPA